MHFAPTLTPGRIYGWKTFTFKGKHFLGLDCGQNWHVVNDDMENYGRYFNIDSFKKMYLRRGEELNLSLPVPTVVLEESS